MKDDLVVACLVVVGNHLDLVDTGVSRSAGEALSSAPGAIEAPQLIAIGAQHADEDVHGDLIDFTEDEELVTRFETVVQRLDAPFGRFGLIRHPDSSVLTRRFATCRGWILLPLDILQGV